MEWTRSGKTLDPKKTIKQVSDCGQEEKRIRNRAVKMEQKLMNMRKLHIIIP